MWGGHSCPPPLILTLDLRTKAMHKGPSRIAGHNIAGSKPTPTTADKSVRPHNLLAESSISRAGLECRRVSFGDAAVFTLPDFDDARRYNRRAIRRMPE